jgi:hypothetical protein
VLENQYRRLTEAEHKAMFLAKGSIKQEDGFKEYITAFCTRKYMSDFAKEMNRSAKRYLAKYSK